MPFGIPLSVDPRLNLVCSLTNYFSIQLIKDNEENVYKQDFARPTLEDHFDKTILPKVMQVGGVMAAYRVAWPLVLSVTWWKIHNTALRKSVVDK